VAGRSIIAAEGSRQNGCDEPKRRTPGPGWRHRISIRCGHFGLREATPSGAAERPASGPFGARGREAPRRWQRPRCAGAFGRSCGAESSIVHVWLAFGNRLPSGSGFRFHGSTASRTLRRTGRRRASRGECATVTCGRCVRDVRVLFGGVGLRPWTSRPVLATFGSRVQDESGTSKNAGLRPEQDAFGRPVQASRCGHPPGSRSRRSVERGAVGREVWLRVERQGGNGRGDAVRLPTRGILRGV